MIFAHSHFDDRADAHARHGQLRLSGNDSRPQLPAVGSVRHGFQQLALYANPPRLFAAGRAQDAFGPVMNERVPAVAIQPHDKLIDQPRGVVASAVAR